MIIHKHVKAAVEVRVQYPAYYKTDGIISSDYVAVFSDRLALKLSADSQSVNLWRSTPEEAFAFPPYEAYQSATEQEFLVVLQQANRQVRQTLDMFLATLST